MKSNLLVICDISESSKLIEEILNSNSDYNVILLQTKTKADLKLHQEKINISDLLILDIQNNDQFEYSNIIRNELSKKELPIIFLSSCKDEKSIKAAFNLGRVDYICKPFNDYELIARVKEQLNLKELYEGSKLKNSMLELISEKLVEKNTILETSLDILIHDTKNQFLDIQFNLSRKLNNDTRRTLREQIDNLYELVMETAGYMSSKKRICSIYEIVKSIHFTKDRIPIMEHKNIKLEYSSPGILFIESSLIIKNAIINLIENALKYSPAGTEINVKLKRTGRRIYIHVENRGMSIPNSEKHKIFRKHYSRNKTKAIEGTGWGLWITHRVVKKEGGMVYVSDNPGGGSVFTIELPAFYIKNLDHELRKLSNWFKIPLSMIMNKEETIRTMLTLQDNQEIEDIETCIFTSLLMYFRKLKHQKSKIIIHRKLDGLKKLNPGAKSVLIVDDSIYVHYYMATYLTELGYRILDYAKNGRDGVSFYKEYKPDLVTMDYTMPVLSGLDAAKEIYDYDQNAHILFITSVGQDHAFVTKANSMLPKEKIRVLVKPITKAEVETALEDFI